MPKFKAALQFIFPSEFDGRLLPHWDIVVDLGGGATALFECYDNPLRTRQGIKLREKHLEGGPRIIESGIIKPGEPGNKTRKDAYVEIIEKDIPVRVFEENDDTIKMKFGGKRLKGTLIVDRKNGNAFWAGRTGPRFKDSDPQTVIRIPQKDNWTPLQVSIDTSDYEAMQEKTRQIINDSFCIPAAMITEVFRVTWQDKEKYFSRRSKAEAYASKYDDAKISKINALPQGAKFEENVYRVEHGGTVKWFSTPDKAHAYKDKNPGAKVSSSPTLPKSATLTSATDAPEGKVYQVIWADGRGVQYFDNLEAAEEFAKQRDRDARPPKLIDKPAGARVKSEAPTIQEAMLDILDATAAGDPKLPEPDAGIDATVKAICEQAGVEYGEEVGETIVTGGKQPSLLEAVVKCVVKIGIHKVMEAIWGPADNPGGMGTHDHPHGFGGDHSHGAPLDKDPGKHAHDTQTWGGHRHRPGDPIDGQHLNVGEHAMHSHLLALGLEEYIAWSIDAHLVHPWVKGFKKAWIKHIRPSPPEKDFREATAADWREHTIWNLHSNGWADSEAHGDVFLSPRTRIIEKEYELDDGTRRAPTQEDFEAETEWMWENLPPGISKRLGESGIEISDRYSAMGIDYPKPETVCLGACEGCGFFPVYMEKGDTEAKHKKNMAVCTTESNPKFIELWEEAEKRGPGLDGWHFVKCPECAGTGKRVKEAGSLSDMELVNRILSGFNGLIERGVLKAQKISVAENAGENKSRHELYKEKKSNAKNINATVEN